jgi:hypothetical protein
MNLEVTASNLVVGSEIQFFAQAQCNDPIMDPVVVANTIETHGIGGWGDGTHYIYALASIGGATSECSEPLSITVDTVAPPMVASGSIGVKGGADTLLDSQLEDSTVPPTFQWSMSETNSKYWLYIYSSDGSNPITGCGEVTAPNVDMITFSAVCVLTSGNSYRLKIQAVDAADNASSVTEFNFFVSSIN